MVYYRHHLGLDRYAGDRYRDSPHFQAYLDFCERWDQGSFDPDYDTPPLEHFEPMLRDAFAREPWASSVIREGGAVAAVPRPGMIEAVIHEWGENEG